VHWGAPLTTGFECIIPKGTILIASTDCRSSTLAISCIPEDSAEFEKQFVPESDRTADKYAGYSLLFWRFAIGKKLRVL